MSEILAIRDKIRDFLRKFDEITTPIFRFIAAYIMFSTINSLYGYSDLFDKGIVVFLLSVISALVSTSVIVFLGGIVVLVNSFAISLEVGICALFLFMLMYCLYMRMFPECGWILVLVPVLYMLKLYYVIPIVVAIFVGSAGIVPAAFGVVLYNFALYVKDVKEMMVATVDDKDFHATTYLVDSILKNKEMLLQIIVFAIVILVTFIVYKLPVDYSWYIAIGVGAVSNILLFIVCGAILDVDVEMGSLIFGSLLGALISVVIQLCKSMVDYSRKETVQFEDDEYYYYVKAIPKMNVAAKNKNVVNITNNQENVVEQQ